MSVSIESEWAGRAAVHALKDAGAFPVTLPWSAISAEGLSGSAALVYDLCPWTPAVEHRFDSLAGSIPGVPILLYLPPTGSAFAAYARASRHPHVQVQVQSRDGASLECLRDAACGLLRSVPRVRIMNHLSDAVPSLSSAAYLFGHRALSILGSGRRPRVGEIATALHLSARTLQRRFKDDGLPHPKSLLDWLTIMHLHCAAETQELSVARVASRAGLSANDLYRLRRRAARVISGARGGAFPPVRPLDGGRFRSFAD
ncbi:MAG TPA: hypothetical protein VGA37_07270 [Gemmatimonadales bacterium]